MTRKQNNFGAKYSNQEKKNRKAKYLSNMGKEIERFEEEPKAKIHVDSLRATLTKYQIGKLQAIMAYMDSGSKNLPPFMTD